MILTLTVNPSLDRTVELNAPLAHGAVQRAKSATQDPGGKGVNISRALAAAQVPTLAIVPGEATDPVLTGLTDLGLEYANLPTGEPIRSNITVVDPDGTTTKINAPGTVFNERLRRELDLLVSTQSQTASWIVLAGSLPPGLGPEYYSELIERLHRTGFTGKIALDTSEETLRESMRGKYKPTLIKPNAEELAQLVPGTHWEKLEQDPVLAARTGAELVREGTSYVLVTLGSAGAVLVTTEGAWHARHEPVTVRSTVGAGDCSLAGFLIAHTRGDSPAQCLVQAVAHGSAAASLPGTSVPTLEQTSPQKVTLTQLAL